MSNCGLSNYAGFRSSVTLWCGGVAFSGTERSSYGGLEGEEELWIVDLGQESCSAPRLGATALRGGTAAVTAVTAAITALEGSR